MSRIRSIDIVRGSAMFLVILAHTFGLCDPEKLGAWFSSHIGLVTQSASVAFMFCSGMIATYLMQMSDDWPSVRFKMIKRGLFLIFVVHPVLFIVTYEYFGSQQNGLYNLFHVYQITDTIGVCLVIAPFIIRASNRALRMFLIFTLLSATVLARIWWNPETTVFRIAKISLVGVDPGGESVISVGWPLLPWLAIYLTGSFAGEMYTRLRKNVITYSEAARQAWRAAVMLIASGLLLTFAYVILKRINPLGWETRVFSIIYPSRTTTLLPCYLGAVAGFAALLIKQVDGRSTYNRFCWGLSLLGRTSLFTFVTQFIVVWTIPALLGLKGTLGYLGLATTLCVGLLVSTALAYPYGRIRGRVAANEYRLVLRNAIR